jgi:hypothetical protein
MPTDEALHRYAGLGEGGPTARWQPAMPKAVAEAWVAQDGASTAMVAMSRPFELGIRLTETAAAMPTHVEIEIANDQGDVIHHSADLFGEGPAGAWRRGHRVVTLPADALFAGRHRLSLQVWDAERGQLEHALDILQWDVIADRPVFTLYPPSVWRGATGPALLSWDHRDTLVAPTRRTTGDAP